MEFTIQSKTDLSEQQLQSNRETFGLARVATDRESREQCHMFKTRDARRCILVQKYLFTSQLHRNLEQVDLRQGKTVASFRRMAASVPCVGSLRGRLVLQQSSSDEEYNDFYVLYDPKRRKLLCRMPAPGNRVLISSKMNPCRDGVFATSPHSFVVLRGSKELYSVDYFRRERVTALQGCRSRGQFIEQVMPCRADPAVLYLLYFDTEDRSIVGEVLGKDLPLRVSAFDSRSQRHIKRCKLDRIYRPFHSLASALLEVSGHHFLMVADYTNSIIRLYLFDAFRHAALFAPAPPSKQSVSSVAQGGPVVELRCLQKMSLGQTEDDHLRLAAWTGSQLSVLTCRSLLKIALRFDEQVAESSCALI